MGTLIVNQINLNDRNMVNRLRSAIQKFIGSPSSYYFLKFKPQYYFEIPNGPLPSERGWYIVLGDRTPIYVGKTLDLNARLNTNNRSIDNFANQGRASDSERNFIKKFDELSIFKGLRLCIIREKELCSELGLDPSNLTDLDRGNMEKFINIFRYYFNYK